MCWQAKQGPQQQHYSPTIFWRDLKQSSLQVKIIRVHWMKIMKKNAHFLLEVLTKITLMPKLTIFKFWISTDNKMSTILFINLFPERHLAVTWCGHMIAEKKLRYLTMPLLWTWYVLDQRSYDTFRCDVLLFQTNTPVMYREAVNTSGASSLCLQAVECMYSSVCEWEACFCLCLFALIQVSHGSLLMQHESGFTLSWGGLCKRLKCVYKRFVFSIDEHTVLLLHVPLNISSSMKVFFLHSLTGAL